MIKIFKKLIKSNSDYYKKYVLIYSTGVYSDYKFMYCDEKELKKNLEQIDIYKYHIFLTKDELKIETISDFNFDEEVNDNEV